MKAGFRRDDGLAPDGAMRIGICRLSSQKASRCALAFDTLQSFCLSKRSLFEAVSYVLERSLEIVRNEGVRSLWYKVKGIGGIRYDYSRWLTHNWLTDEDIRLIAEDVARLSYKPLISVIAPVYNTDEKWLRRCIESVQAQLFPNWEMCIADDASTMGHVRRVLEEYASGDPRIKLAFRESNGHISEASNSALALATGEFVALLDHDDELPVHALYMIARELNDYPQTDLIYTDEDKIDAKGNRFDPHFKPDWSPDLLHSYNYICHLGVYRREIAQSIGGFRKGFEGSQDYDFLLRFIERTAPERIRHIPHVLYHWRSHRESTALSGEAKNYALSNSRKALTSHMDRIGLPVEVVESECSPSRHRVVYPLPEPAPRVSLIIPTRNCYALLKGCIDGILHETRYPDLEIVIMDNDSDSPDVKAYFEELRGNPAVKIVFHGGEFNFSAINNAAVRHCSGQVIGFLNNDLRVISRDWLREMVSHAARPEVGAVGAKLIYPDERVQHAGIILGIGKVAGHSHKYYRRNHPGYFSRLQVVQNFSAVTAACLIMRRDVFEQVGGFDESNLCVAFNDVDLCLRIRESGYLIVWTPYAELYHLESASRGSEDTPERKDRFLQEGLYMQHTWGEKLLRDPYYNANLALNREDFSIGYPSRAPKPWTP